MSFNSNIEFFNLFGGLYSGSLQNMTGVKVLNLPGLMPVGAAILSLGLSYLGARKLRRG
jgi:hypothetical protein